MSATGMALLLVWAGEPTVTPWGDSSVGQENSDPDLAGDSGCVPQPAAAGAQAERTTWPVCVYKGGDLEGQLDTAGPKPPARLSQG